MPFQRQHRELTFSTVDDLHQDPLPIRRDDAPEHPQENAEVIDNSSEDETGYALFLPPDTDPIVGRDASMASD